MTTSITSSPRIAVVGGGIAGTLCSLVLKNRGFSPVILDAGTRGLGGRLRGGAQFLRASDGRLMPILSMLESAKIIHPWRGRFGLLGSSGGGFLPEEVVTSGISHSGSGGVAGLSPADPNAPQGDTPPPTDGGDFCQFVHGSKNTTTFVGTQQMADVCPQIAALAQLSTVSGTKVTGGSMAATKDGGWVLEMTDEKRGESSQHFDGLVVATHDPSLASSFVNEIVTAEVKAGGHVSLNEAMTSGEKDNDDSLILLKRLSNLAKHLQQVRETGRTPLYTLQATYPPGFSKALPFDAVSLPGSPVLQFLAREASKLPPGSDATETEGDVWTAIATSQLAASVLGQEIYSDDDQKAHISRVLTGELEQLLGRYFENQNVPEPTDVSVKRWGAAFSLPGLELQEDSITLAPWRLGICGDFIRQSSAYPTPWEAAALSGLEAGERMAALFVQQE